MAYTKQNFVDQQVLTASHLNHIEDGIVANESNIVVVDGKLGARNLLDNSDFRNPVNQRGQTSYTGSKYTIDRWRTYQSANTVTVSSGYISQTGTQLLQKINPSLVDGEKTYTVAVCEKNGTIHVASGILKNEIVGNNAICYYDTNIGYYCFAITKSGDYLWAALYEGEYTAETLPEYQPKGYAAEFAECRRYYQKGTQTVTVGTQYGTTDKGMARLRFENMRITPTISLISVSSQGWSNIAVSNFAIGWNGADGADHFQNYTVSGDSTFVGQTVGISYEASAEL